MKCRFWGECDDDDGGNQNQHHIFFVNNFYTDNDCVVHGYVVKYFLVLRYG